MKKKSEYVQCTLNKKHVWQIAYIPKEYAELNRVVDLKEGDDWSRGWLVKFVSSAAMSHDDMLERSQDYKNARKASDI